MRRFALALALASCAAISVSQTYPRQGIRLNAQIPLSGFDGSPTSGAGCTGYVSPSGREYAIMGLRTSTAFVEVTNPSAPVIVAQIPMPASTWHENAVAGPYAYLVTEAGGGVRIVDMSNIDNGVVTHVATYTGNSLNNVHTVQALGDYVYLNGSNRGFVILDVSNKTAPVEVSRWTTRYVHDSYIHRYTSGPYAGRTIAFLCCAGNGLYIVDITNPSTIVNLGNVAYIPSNGYCHSGALTADGKYFLINDEFDERNSLVETCSTHIINVENLSLPTYVGAFTNNENIIDHNSRMKDGFLVLAAYRGGLRIYDASNPLAMRETGFFDTYPSGSGFTYDGAWGTYIFPSNTAVIADIQRGLFVVDPSEAMGLGAVPLGISVTRGALIGGALKDARRADGASIALKGSTIPTPKARGVIAEVQYETGYSPVTALNLTVVARLQGMASGEMVVEIKNQANGQWQPLLKEPLNTSDRTITVNGISPTNRISSSGRIDLRVNAYSLFKVQEQSFVLHL
ncbi:MAG TPA: choice-of-anchor B family protein, partial [Fimbriimonadaceae bacterium]|nr:choice-of-anchor B family protein [Fimbriimonadaceae bacterium]